MANLIALVYKMARYCGYKGSWLQVVRTFLTFVYHTCIIPYACIRKIPMILASDQAYSLVEIMNNNYYCVFSSRSVLLLFLLKKPQLLKHPNSLTKASQPSKDFKCVSRTRHHNNQGQHSLPHASFGICPCGTPTMSCTTAMILSHQTETLLETHHFHTGIGTRLPARPVGT